MSQTLQLVYLLIVLPLAAGAIVDVWRNGSIFVEQRALTEVRATAFELGERTLRNFLAALLDCTFCMSYHVPAWLLLTQYLPAVVLHYFSWHRTAWVLLLPSFSLAATRVSWLLNGLVPDHLRYGYRLHKDRDTHRPDVAD